MRTCMSTPLRGLARFLSLQLLTYYDADEVTIYTRSGRACRLKHKEEGQEGGSGRKADVWSLGCCVLAMGTLATPIGTR